MDTKKFNVWSRIVATAVFSVALVTYLMTIEPTASFWDCGEFIASSYKLEVGHPPGNPVFQLFARIFTMFAGAEHAAVAVNVMSALSSALTILLLYLTIVFFAKRLLPSSGHGDSYGKTVEAYSPSAALAIMGSGAVGALVYCFSDTFWFSAVEGEVYALSSLFTALVFWAMTKWYEQADKPYANRWIVLISFLMGLSIGIHLLNLLAIPALVFMFYYRRREQGTYTFMEHVKIFLISCAILAVILWGIIPYLPKIAAYIDLFFVNALGLPFNSGAVVFMLLLLGLCFWGLFATMKKDMVVTNTVLLCFTTIIIGFSLFSIVIIRSSVKTPTNEYQPDNPFTLVRYLGREQYGSQPLLYGQYFDAPYEIEVTKYWAPLGDRYIKTDGQPVPVYDKAGKMFFPRMHSSVDRRYTAFYLSYMNGKGKVVPGAQEKKPTFGANMRFFLDYQLNWMYWRYFMWNFAGRQNDIHSPAPGDVFNGNWECGIPVLDELRLGDQSDAPAYLKENKGKNHYFLLPLLLGLIGIFFQFARDKRGSWLVFLMFFMTGIAIVVYLNQTPFQVRERDYAYAGSFYTFAIWCGLGVAAIYSLIKYLLENTLSSESSKLAVSGAVALACLGVPVLMAAENWDDHDRSNRYTAVEVAENYLNSVGPNGILITHGDNDTFPIWYAQEVEGIRTDVRICNTSLLGTDWHIDQMKYAVNESAPLNLTVKPEQYLYGTNEFIFIYDSRNTVVPISTVMEVFKHPKAKVQLTSGREADYIMSRKISVPVNKENVIKYGILDEKYADLIPDEIILTISEDKEHITKPELFMLDFLSNYQWDRPLNMLNMGGEINIGIKDYLMFDGFSYRFVPIKNRTSLAEPGLVDTDDLYNKMMNVYKWDALKRTDYFVDYQNIYTFCGVMPQRGLFVISAREMMKAGENDKALKLLEKCLESVPEANFPLDMSSFGFSNEKYVLEMINLFFMLDCEETALDLSNRFAGQLKASTKFYLQFYEFASDKFESVRSCLQILAGVLDDNGYPEEAEKIETGFNEILDQAIKGLES